MEQTTIIMSKLTPPITSSFYMRRSSLIKKLKTNTNSKLSILHSGAGFGKSSALAQVYADSKELYSWYTISEEDDNILPFLRYLVQSIRQVIPTFGESLMERDLLSMYPKEEELTQWYSLFSNELTIIEEPFSIVLDDFHLIDHVFHINFVIEKIIEFLPAHIHLVVASRTRPKWSILLKLKLKGQLVEIIEKDFMFTEEEIQVFFEDYFERTISDEEAAEIMKLTEGWAIAIHLIAMQLAETGRHINELVDPTLNDLFSYLSEEVFFLMSDEDKQSLLNFSIFPIFTEKEIREFFGDNEANDLERLSSSHAFIQSLSNPGSYRFHALFQQFLETKWLQKDSSLYFETHKRAAHYFSEQQNIIQSIYHAVKANDDYFLGTIILQFAAFIIKDGQFDWFLDLLKEHFSDNRREEFYELFFYEGECHRYRAFYEKARKAYETCLAFAMNNENPLYISRANVGLAHIYLDTIQPALAKPFLENAVKWAENSSEMGSHERIILKRLLAENLVNLGKANEAKDWVQQEELEASILKEGNLDARILLRTGLLNEAEVILRNRINDEINLPDSHRETEVLLSFIYSLTGNIEEAKRSAIKGIETGIRERSSFVEAVGWIRRGHAEILENPFDLETPENYYLKAVHGMGELNVSRGKAEPFMGLAILKSRQGLLQEAISYGESGLRETNKGNDYWLSAYILVCLTIVYVENDLMDEALQKIYDANRLFISGGDVYGEMISDYWLMIIYDKLGDNDKFVFHAEKFASICVQYEFTFFLLKKTIFGPADIQLHYPLLQKAIVLEPSSIAINTLANLLKLNKSINYPGYQLTLQLFGPFTLFMGYEEISEKKWQRDKSKELLTYLYLNRNRFVPKEELMHAIWGEGDEKSLNRDFKVVLNALLKVIEPNRLAREESFFIVRKQAMYRINPEAAVTSDLESFQQLTEQGLEEKNPLLSADYLLKAVKLYKGELFEDKSRIDWISHDREKNQQQYLFVLERLAQTYTRLKEFEKSIYWAEKLVRMDPTWEEAYRLLMFAYYQLQNRTQAVKWYEKCISVLNIELKVEPMHTTIQMYEMITSYG
ncbi:BTAD domain-containing putative transcriptional regulator [Psychrobacillus sp. OK032]|uniref:BTAD domain-containing putative transcriptional regulator n=1 Tax=Psychrobacillus sp. OK032 TaxID=1884358 RepID=UPI0008C8D569|nr:BTAD domain-containing putative transcriptional regulator [Psychrobacillus sp. OK032]SES11679.1 transcriptional regulator [Psychrobacillus sp. OK032]